MLREYSLYEKEIKSWKVEINQALLQVKEIPKREQELKKQNEALTKELRKKDKALAEVTALLVLKKNFKLFMAKRTKRRNHES